MEISLQTIFFALLGGVIPALLWLFFWLREDKKRPEPRGLLFLSFIGGMIVVPIVIPFEKMVTANIHQISLTTIFLWALIEEVFKYLASYFTALKNKAMDEPIDPIIYLITTALGFAALENTLFLINAIANGEIIQSIITGNLRFIGATLLHTISSGVIGASMALAFYKRDSIKRFALFGGLVLSVVLHTLFNFFIMDSASGGALAVFGVVWILIVLLILFFEKVKKIRR